MRITYGSSSFLTPQIPRSRSLSGTGTGELLQPGIKTFWLDETEPSYSPYDYRNIRLTAGNG
jgi:hypothetical protein